MKKSYAPECHIKQENVVFPVYPLSYVQSGAFVVSIIVTVLAIASSGHAYAASNGQSSGQGGDGGSGSSATQANTGSMPAANGAGGTGGDGGVQTQTGGAGGSSVSGGSTAPNGSAGLSGTYGGGGGGGGGALLSSLSSQSSFAAGNGGEGGDGINAAGSGGAGGSVYTTAPVASVTLHITGGNGGAGGYGLTSTKFGHGGRGGDALVVQAAQSKITIESTAVLLGGNGGEGGDGNNSSLSGSGGDGGNGVSLAQNVDLYIQSGAQVSGGSAGSAGQQGQYIGAAGQSGVGVYMAGNDQLTTAGTISGGTQSGSNPVVAVQLDGGGNTLTLLQGYVFNGSVSSSGNDTLVLGGDVNGIFTGTINQSASSNCTQSFCGFTNYEKNGASTWQLATPTTQALNWTIVDGTLQATTDTLGSGAITDNANLALVQSTDGTVSNLITGTGSLSKGGNGTLTLTAANSYSGGTLITAGTLEGTASSFGSGAITDNGVLALVQPTDATLSNLITGTGSLSKEGSGTLTLATTNSYSGGTLITAGILKGAASSFGSGSITNNATLNVTSSSSADTLNNTVTGTGELLVSGSGTLTLGGVNSYSGKTSLLSGGLRLMQSSALGDSLLDMAAGTTLTLGQTGLAVKNAISLNTGTGIDVQSGTDVLSGVLSDGTQQGTLVKTGSGTLILSGVNSYTGETDIADGTLQATSDALGSGAITDNANLALVQSTDGTVSNLITGTGSLSKGGSGTLALTAVNSYSGGTLITAGTLEGTASSFGSGAITDNGVLALVQPTDATLSNLITGTGSLSNGGSGTLTLTAANSYSGGTLITAGILKGAASSFGSGSITNNATLNVTSSSSADTLNNTVTGTGELLVSGSGTLTLGGVNSYSGKTSLLSGGLRLMQSSALGDSLLDMAAGTTLTLGRTGLAVKNAISLNTGTGIDVQSGTDVLSGVLSDGTQQGTLVKTGSGTLILSGVNSYTGATDIADGTLRVDGSVATSSSITADNGTTLSGSGIVGNTIMESGSTLLPVSDAGNATLTVNGNLTLQSGSTYMVDSTQLGGSDRVEVTGTATLGSGANITFNPGLWEVGTSYDLLHADQQVNGVFGSITTTLAFLTPTLTYTADDILVSFLRNQASFASIGQSRNEQAAGSGLDSLQSGAMWNNIVDSDARTARRAFNLLSGEIHASVRTSLVQDSFYVRDAVIDRLLAADCRSVGTMGQKTLALNERGIEGGCIPHAAVWIQNYGSFAHTVSDGNASSLSDNAGGFVLGLDAPVAGWHVGVMSGYGHSDLNASSVGSTGKSDNVHIGAYAGTQWGQFGLRLGAAYTFDMLSSNRKVVFNEYNATLKAHYGAGTAQAFGELGYRMDLGRISAEPFANVAFVSTHSARYSEQGADAALAVDAQSQGTTLSTFGAHLGSHFKLMGVMFKPLATLAYRHAFGGITPTVNERFAGGSVFEVAGAPLASDSAVVNAGLSANVTDRLDLNLSYIAQYATMTTINGVTGSARLQF